MTKIEFKNLMRSHFKTKLEIRLMIKYLEKGHLWYDGDHVKIGHSVIDLLDYTLDRLVKSIMKF